jgi:hypothetical protein
LAATTSESVNGSSIASSQSGMGTQSSSVNRIMGALASLAPLLRAAAGPAFD